MVTRGEPKPKGTAWRECTLGSAIELGMKHTITCDDCCRIVMIQDHAAFAAHYRVPLDTPLWTLVQNLKCSQCGSIRITLMVAPHEQPGHPHTWPSIP
jgi:hypothetical protein